MISGSIEVKQPDTQKKAIEELWNAVIGTNGDGLKVIAKENKEDIGIMKTDVAFIKGRLEGQSDSKPSKKIITLKKILESFAAMFAVALVIGGVILLVIGKLKPEDIAMILNALRGGG